MIGVEAFRKPLPGDTLERLMCPLFAFIVLASGHPMTAAMGRELTLCRGSKLDGGTPPCQHGRDTSRSLIRVQGEKDP